MHPIPPPPTPYAFQQRHADDTPNRCGRVYVATGLIAGEPQRVDGSDLRRVERTGGLEGDGGPQFVTVLHAENERGDSGQVERVAVGNVGRVLAPTLTERAEWRREQIIATVGAGRIDVAIEGRGEGARLDRADTH